MKETKYMRKDPSCLLSRVLYEMSSTVSVQVNKKELNEFGVIEHNKSSGKGLQTEEFNFEIVETKENSIMPYKCDTSRSQLDTETTVPDDSWIKFKPKDKVQVRDKRVWTVYKNTYYDAKIKRHKRAGDEFPKNCNTNTNNIDIKADAVLVGFLGKWTATKYDYWIEINKKTICKCATRSCRFTNHLIRPSKNYQKQIPLPAHDTFLLDGSKMNGYVQFYQQKPRGEDKEIIKEVDDDQKAIDKTFRDLIKECNIDMTDSFIKGDGFVQYLAKAVVPKSYRIFLKKITKLNKERKVEQQKKSKAIEKIQENTTYRIQKEFFEYYKHKQEWQHQRIQGIIDELKTDLDIENSQVLDTLNNLQYDRLVNGPTAIDDKELNIAKIPKKLFQNKLKNILNDHNKKKIEIEKRYSKSAKEKQKQTKIQNNNTIREWITFYKNSMSKFTNEMYGDEESIQNKEEILKMVDRRINNKYETNKAMLQRNLENDIKQKSMPKSSSIFQTIQKKTATLTHFRKNSKTNQVEIKYVVPTKVP
eukprot:192319_1